MQLRRRRGWLGLVVALSIVAGPWPGAPASASCVAPYLKVTGDLGLGPGSELVVKGWRLRTAATTLAAPAFGCSVDEPESGPLNVVTLHLRQGGIEWDLRHHEVDNAFDGHEPR